MLNFKNSKAVRCQKYAYLHLNYLITTLGSRVSSLSLYHNAVHLADYEQICNYQYNILNYHTDN